MTNPQRNYDDIYSKIRTNYRTVPTGVPYLPLVCRAGLTRSDTGLTADAAWAGARTGGGPVHRTVLYSSDCGDERDLLTRCVIARENL